MANPNATSETPEQVVRRLEQAFNQGCAIDFDDGFPDKRFPELTWFAYGIHPSNEVVVIVSVGTLRLGIAGPSGLIYPAMIDRRFGIDVADLMVARDLADQMWEKHSERLIAEAIRVRRAKGGQ